MVFHPPFYRYDPASDLLTFSVDYDLDQAGYDQDVTAIMTATDSKGASSTATVNIHIFDVNDNKCQPDPVVSSQRQELGHFCFMFPTYLIFKDKSSVFPEISLFGYNSVIWLALKCRKYLRPKNNKITVTPAEGATD